MFSPPDLPNDIAALKALLLAQDEVVGRLREQLSTRVVEIEHLKLQIAKLRRMQFAGPGLLAHVLMAKFADHLPLYRQSVIYAREGVDLDRALLVNWVGAASALLRPLVDAIRRHVLAASKLPADDTPIPVLAPGNGKTKTARLWTYVRDDRPAGDTSPPVVWFAYTPDRKGIHLSLIHI